MSCGTHKLATPAELYRSLVHSAVISICWWWPQLLWTHSGGKPQVLLHDSMDRVREILEHHKVDAYFNGHLHSLEHRTLNDVVYIVSGAGGKLKDYDLRADHKIIPGWTAADAGVTGGFATLTVDLAKGDVSIRYLDSHGKELFR
eukprot:5280894-Pyramimonas_sp.AAC.4